MPITRVVVLLVTLASCLPHARCTGAAELTSKEFGAEIDSLPEEQRKINDPSTAIQAKSAAVRFFAIGSLDPSLSTDHEQALLSALEDEVKWLRYTAAVKLTRAELHAEEVAPVLVEALRFRSSDCHFSAKRFYQALFEEICFTDRANS